MYMKWMHTGCSMELRCLKWACHVVRLQKTKPWILWEPNLCTASCGTHRTSWEWGSDRHSDWLWAELRQLCSQNQAAGSSWALPAWGTLGGCCRAKEQLDPGEGGSLRSSRMAEGSLTASSVFSFLSYGYSGNMEKETTEKLSAG